MLLNYKEFTTVNNYFESKRAYQSRQIMLDFINNRLYDHFYHDPEIRKRIIDAEQKLDEKTLSPYQAAAMLLDKYFGKNG